MFDYWVLLVNKDTEYSFFICFFSFEKVWLLLRFWFLCGYSCVVRVF